jgi:hypothetical protein
MDHLSAHNSAQNHRIASGFLEPNPSGNQDQRNLSDNEKIASVETKGKDNLPSNLFLSVGTQLILMEIIQTNVMQEFTF